MIEFEIYVYIYIYNEREREKIILGFFGVEYFGPELNIITNYPKNVLM